MKKSQPKSKAQRFADERQRARTYKPDSAKIGNFTIQVNGDAGLDIVHELPKENQIIARFDAPDVPKLAIYLIRHFGVDMDAVKKSWDGEK